jgi:hypothetical protein
MAIERNPLLERSIFQGLLSATMVTAVVGNLAPTARGAAHVDLIAVTIGRVRIDVAGD